MARQQEISLPTRHELEQERKLLLTLRAGIVADRDQGEARIRAQNAKIIDAQLRIRKYVHRAETAPRRLESIEEKIARVEEQIADFGRVKKGKKLARRDLDALVIAGMGAKDENLQARARELLEQMNAKVDFGTLWEKFGDLRAIYGKE